MYKFLALWKNSCVERRVLRLGRLLVGVRAECEGEAVVLGPEAKAEEEEEAEEARSAGVAAGLALAGRKPEESLAAEEEEDGEEVGMPAEVFGRSQEL